MDDAIPHFSPKREDDSVMLKNKIVHWIQTPFFARVRWCVGNKAKHHIQPDSLLWPALIASWPK